MMKAFAIPAALTLATLTGACEHALHSYTIPEPASLQRIQSVAVLPFENLTTNQDAGTVVTNLFFNELNATQSYQLTEKIKVDKWVTRLGSPAALATPLQMMDGFPTIDRSLAQQIGEILEVDGIIFGSVGEYRYQASGVEEGVEEPMVAVNARLVEVETGQVIWASSYSHSGTSMISRSKVPLDEVAREAVQGMVKTLK